jgi:hypothetical protein
MAGRKPLVFDLDEVVQYIGKGYKQNEIATIYGVHENTLNSFLKNNNLNKKMRTNNMNGEQSS